MVVLRGRGERGELALKLALSPLSPPSSLAPLSVNVFTNVYQAQQLIPTLGKKQLSNPWETAVSLGKIQTLGLINNLNNNQTLGVYN